MSAKLLVPITPHTSEHIWSVLLKRPGCILNSGWPVGGSPDWVMQRAAQYIEDTIPALRKLIQKAEAPPKKKGPGEVGLCHCFRPWVMWGGGLDGSTKGVVVVPK